MIRWSERTVGLKEVFNGCSALKHVHDVPYDVISSSVKSVSIE